MTKKILGTALACLLATSAYGFSGYVETGFELDDYRSEKYSKYGTGDVFKPYVKFDVRPIKDSSLRINFEYKNYNEYGRKEYKNEADKFKPRRNQFTTIIYGYQWKAGGFTFAPRVGLDAYNQDINEKKTTMQTENWYNVRFYPNWTYNINKNTELYLSGYIGPVIAQTERTGRRDSENNKVSQLNSRTYWDDWKQDMEVLGLRYTFANKNKIWTSLASLYEKQEYVQENDRWQLRTGFNWYATPKLTVNPYIRYDLRYKVTNEESKSYTGNRNGLEKDLRAVRVGFTWQYKFTSDLSAVGEIHYVTDKQQDWGGIKKERRYKMFYELGLRKAF